jgi:putative FmdB family regulatory protein
MEKTVPIYEYECEKCSFKFELLKKVGEDGGAPCPKCQGHSPRVFSRMSYIWTGERHAGEKPTKKESSKPKEQSDEKLDNDKKPESSEKKDKSTPPHLTEIINKSDVERNETNQ